MPQEYTDIKQILYGGRPIVTEEIERELIAVVFKGMYKKGFISEEFLDRALVNLEGLKL